MQQIILPFGHQSDYSREGFFVSESNSQAYEIINKWPDWPSHCVIVYGSQSCGKTHLANIWKEKAGASIVDTSSFNTSQINDNYVVEDIDRLDNPEMLFYLYNSTKEKGLYLLLTSNIPPSLLKVNLLDLSSRLNSCFSVEMKLPDDELLKIYISKQFSDRQIRVEEEVINYIINRIDRSFSSVLNIINKIDEYSFLEKRNITIPLVKKVVG